MKSRLILIDGISGSGKDSQVRDLIEFLKLNTSYKIHSFKEPHYLRDEIKALRKTPNFDKKKSLNLFVEDRKILLKDYAPLLQEENNICVLNRSKLTTYVIQQLEGFELNELIKMHEFYPTPDLALILSCDPEIAMERIKKRKETTGEPISPNENLNFISNQYRLYKKLGEKFDFVYQVNANGREEAINLIIQSRIKKLLGIQMNKAIFLDKDGTLVDNSGYPDKIPSDNIYSFSFEGLKKVQEKGYKLFIVSSQPWVARGSMTSKEVENIFKSIVKKYAEKGVIISDYGYCEHHRDVGCPDKKPETRLVENMVKKYNIDLTQSYFVGDMDNDILTGKNIGMKSVLVKTGLGKKHGIIVNPDYVIESIEDLSKIID